MARFQVHVALRKRIDFVTVEIADYRWRSGDVIQDLDHDYILRWRADPPFLSAPAHLSSVFSEGYGQLMFVPPEVPVYSEMSLGTDGIRNVVCRFDPKWLHGVCHLPQWSQDDLQRCFDIKDTNIGRAIQRLGAEVMSPGPQSEILITSLAKMLAVDVSRYFRNELEKPRVRTSNGELSPAHLQIVVDYIEQNIHSPMNVSSLAELCGISAAHLRRAFKKTTGKTVHEYLEKARIDMVKKLLRRTDYPLKEISYRTGFVDSSTFSSTFRRVVGQTPTQYRRNADAHLLPSDTRDAASPSPSTSTFEGPGFDGW
jgi:AraC family transcriptional regulator